MQRVRQPTAALEQSYAPVQASANTARAASDVIFTTLPDCCAIIMRPKCFMHRNVPVRFVPMVAFHSSRLVSCKGVEPRPRAALLKRMSSLPQVSITNLAAFSTLLSSRMSMGQ